MLLVKVLISALWARSVQVRSGLPLNSWQLTIGFVVEQLQKEMILFITIVIKGVDNVEWIYGGPLLPNMAFSRCSITINTSCL